MTATDSGKSGRRTISLAYSVADQSFDSTKSLGILNLSLQLGQALSRRAEVSRFDVFSNTSLHHWHSTLTGSAVSCFDSARASRLGRIAWDQTGAYAQAARSGVDWLVLPKGFASFMRRPPTRIATYVHDVMADYYRSHYPRSSSRLENWYFERSLRATLRYSSVIFTNSQFTREELLAKCERERRTPPPIVVAGIGFDARLPTEHATRDRIVVLASPWPHKRTDLAIEFMQRWQARAGADRVVDWVGRFPEGLPQPNITGWSYHTRLDEASYQRLLGRARVVVYVSEYEGFGMPPVEAVLHGACPVYSALPATRETMQASGAPFDNASFDSFEQAMTTAWTMETAEIQQLAHGLLDRHHWDRVAERVMCALVAATR